MSEEKLELESKPKSCWEVYSSEEDRKAMNKLAAEYLEYLSKCKTERETVDYTIERLKEAGFSEDFASGQCYRALAGKTLFMARKGRKPLSEGVRLIGAHCDTPRIDLKQHPLYEEVGIGLAKTHYYGGIRKYQWLSLQLAMHGVVVKKNGETVNIVIGEDPKDPVFTIADLLPHLARKQSEQKLSEAFVAEKLNIILGHEPAKKEKDENGKEKNGNNLVKRRVLELLNERYGIVEDDFYSAELQMVPAGAARPVGLDGSILGGYGQDDRICCFTALEAFLAQEDPEYTQVLILWDKEEIGSEGSTGAKSRFMEYCIEDLIHEWEPSARPSKVFMNMKALSSDVHAAIDPDYQDLHEKLNSSLFGYGPVFCKFTGHGGKYMANDAHPEFIGWLRGILDEAGVPWQMASLGKVDEGGGGTVAKHLAEYCMDIIDFGPGLLAMHSPFELSSKADVYATVKAYEAFLKN